MFSVPCILPTQVCDGTYRTKDKTSRLSVPMVEGIKFREISYKCTTDRFERVLKSFTVFVGADCSSPSALHQISCNLSWFAGRCFYPVSFKVATWPFFTHSWVIPQRLFCSEPSYSKALPWGFLNPSWWQLQADQCTSSCLEIRSSLALLTGIFLDLFATYIYIHDNTHFPSSLNAVLWKIHALTHADRLYL